MASMAVLRNWSKLTSQRKAGLMKKAWELSVLCAADVSIMIFSSQGKAYEFSSKELDSEIDKYLEVSERSAMMPYKRLKTLADNSMRGSLSADERKNSQPGLLQAKIATMRMKHLVVDLYRNPGQRASRVLPQSHWKAKNRSKRVNPRDRRLGAQLLVQRKGSGANGIKGRKGVERGTIVEEGGVLLMGCWAKRIARTTSRRGIRGSGKERKGSEDAGTSLIIQRRVISL
jgi:hypothetical protein